jgi:hypothetical protein
MTQGQPEKYIAAIFNFGHRVTTALSVSTFIPFIGGTNQATDLSFIVPKKGKLKNLYWDCDTNSLALGSTLEVHVGNVHSSPSTAAPAPAFPLANPSASINLQGTKTTNNPPLATSPCPDPINLDVLPGQRVAVYLRRTGGSILKLRISFELEVEKVSEAWQLSPDNTTVFYDGGKIGIGTATPSEMLEVNGEVKMTRIKLAGGYPGDVITNDSAGYGRWMPSGDKGNQNTGVGYETLRNNSSGNMNTASGYRALYSNTQGANNTTSGFATLADNTLGNWNTANGTLALSVNSLGSYNTANGGNALHFNTIGNSNTANGYGTLQSNTTGSNNTAIGIGADVLFDNLNNATAIGANAKVGTSNSIVLGDLNVNVGIGTTSPSEKLEIVGSIKIKDGNEGVGKVLTSDSDGKGVWANSASMMVPLGSIIAWHKSLVPVALPGDNSWVECNGQQCTDASSIFNGQTIPDLNGALDGKKKFLKGSLISGDVEEDAMQSHKHSEPGHSHYISLHGNGIGPGGWGNYAATGYNTTDQAAVSNSVQVQLGNPVDSGTGGGTPRIANETRPKNMSVVWIMRIK